MIQRIFHPVGQGAFYSERHIQHDINIVYDCVVRQTRVHEPNKE